MIFIATVYLFSSLLFDGELEKGWKGLRVLESNRSDVERLLGRKPAASDKVEDHYVIEDVSILLLYSKGPCVDNTLTGGYNTKAGTVLEYEVVPVKDTLYLKDLKFNRELYERWQNNHVIGLVEYHNRQHGIRIITFMEKQGEVVRTIKFNPTEKQISEFRCDSIKSNKFS